MFKVNVDADIPVEARPIYFKGSRSVFSNFYPHWLKVSVDGEEMWGFSLEQSYQFHSAMYNGYDSVAQEILSVPPGEGCGVRCKQIANNKIDPKSKTDVWKKAKLKIIYSMMQEKLEQLPSFKRALLATDRPLIHPVHSGFWGTGGKDKDGLNMCGKLLMQLREGERCKWGPSKAKVAVYCDSILKHLPNQLEDITFSVQAIPGASVGGKKKMGPWLTDVLEHSGESPDAVILSVGTNDMARLAGSPHLLKHTLTTHVQLVRQLQQRYPQAIVLVSEVLPRQDEKDLQHWVDAYNHQLAQVVASTGARMLYWCDLSTDEKFFRTDGIHPSDEYGIPDVHFSLLGKVRTHLRANYIEGQRVVLAREMAMLHKNRQRYREMLSRKVKPCPPTPQPVSSHKAVKPSQPRTRPPRKVCGHGLIYKSPDLEGKVMIQLGNVVVATSPKCLPQKVSKVIKKDDDSGKGNGRPKRKGTPRRKRKCKLTKCFQCLSVFTGEDAFLTHYHKKHITKSKETTKPTTGCRTVVCSCTGLILQEGCKREIHISIKKKSISCALQVPGPGAGIQFMSVKSTPGLSSGAGIQSTSVKSTPGLSSGAGIQSTSVKSTPGLSSGAGIQSTSVKSTPGLSSGAGIQSTSVKSTPGLSSGAFAKVEHQLVNNIQPHQTNLSEKEIASDPASQNEVLCVDAEPIVTSTSSCCYDINLIQASKHYYKCKSDHLNVQYIGGGSEMKQVTECNGNFNHISRIQSLEVVLPVIRNSISIQCYTDLNQLPVPTDLLHDDPCKLPFLPSESNLKQILVMIDKTKKENKNVVFVKLDYGFITPQCVTHAFALFKIKTLKQMVLDEILWKDEIIQNHSNFPKCLSQCDFTKIEKCCLELQNAKQNSYYKIINYSININALTSVFCERWIDSEIFSVLSKILASKSKDQQVIIMHGLTVVSLSNTDLIHKIQSEISSYNKGYILKYLHVGKDAETGFTFISGFGGQSVVGTHFSLAFYDIQNNRLVYSDSLGWPVPSQLHQKFNSFSSAVGHANIPSVIASHVQGPLCISNNHDNTLARHICNSNCSISYPLQTCSTVCGVVVAIMMVIAVFDKDLFLSIAGAGTGTNSKCCLLEYLRNISQHSTFLRAVLINWIMTETINLDHILLNISNLKKQKSTPVFHPLDSTSTSSKPDLHDSLDNEALLLNSTIHVKNDNKGNVFIKSDNLKSSFAINNNNQAIDSLKKSIDYSLILQYCANKPKIIYNSSKNSYILRCVSLSGRTGDKSFICDRNKKLDKSSILAIKQFVSSTQAIFWIQKYVNLEHKNGIPNILHYEIVNIKPNKLSLRCILENLEKNNFELNFVQSDINNGIAKYKLVTYMKSEFFQTVLSNKKPSKWEYMEFVNVGPDLLKYIENFAFDMNRKIYVHPDCKNCHNFYALVSSIRSHTKWGQSHRMDDTYFIENDISPDTDVLVQINLNCSSKTNVCKSDCGELLTETKKVNNKCNACLFDLTTRCEHCNGNKSRIWYINEKGYICKECSTKSVCIVAKDLPGKHLQCKWSLKLVIYKTDLGTCKVFQYTDNAKYHHLDPVQKGRRLNQKQRDTIDTARMISKATPKQIHINWAGQPITFNDQLYKDDIPLRQIQNRIKVVDKNLMEDNMPNFNRTKSDWKNVENILQEHQDQVLYFHRGSGPQHHHIVIANDENLEYIQEYGKYICGYDIKHDLNSARFKTGILTYCDASNRGRIGAVTICNSEDTEAHDIHFQIILANMKCLDKSCEHRKELYVLNDKSGFFHIRPCALAANERIAMAVVQHDKADPIFNAVNNTNGNSKLCNFHGLRAVRTQCDKKSSFTKFYQCIDIGFKSIMRSFHSIVTKNMVKSFSNFILHKIPNSLFPLDDKEALIKYFIDHWFESKWKKSYSSEILYEINSKKNSLFQTNNITERLFKTWDESVNNNKINRSLATQVGDIITKVLPSNAQDTRLSKDSFNKIKIVCNEKEERIIIQRGLDVKDDVICHDKVLDLGWVFVKATTVLNTLKDIPESISQLQTKDLTNLDYDTLCTESDVSISPLLTAETNVEEEANRITVELTQVACNLYRNEIQKYIPNIDKYNLQGYHLCNIYLGTCTCMYFIQHGQPYFCKHLYAANATFHNIFDVKELLLLYANWKPAIPEDMRYMFPRSIPSCKSPSWNRIEHLISISSITQSFHQSNCIKDKQILCDIKSDKKMEGTSFPGRKAHRKAHNMGYRRKNGPLKEGYVLESNIVSTIDPYRPNIEFPKNSHERHGGRKIKKISKRGISGEQLKISGLKFISKDLEYLATNESKTSCKRKKINKSKILKKLRPNDVNVNQNVQAATTSGFTGLNYTAPQTPYQLHSSVNNSNNMYATCSPNITYINGLNNVILPGTTNYFQAAYAPSVVQVNNNVINVGQNITNVPFQYTMQNNSTTLQNSNYVQMNNGVHFSQLPNLSNMQIPNYPCNLPSNVNFALGNTAYMTNNVPFTISTPPAQQFQVNYDNSSIHLQNQIYLPQAQNSSSQMTNANYPNQNISQIFIPNNTNQSQSQLIDISRTKSNSSHTMQDQNSYTSSVHCDQEIVYNRMNLSQTDTIAQNATVKAPDATTNHNISQSQSLDISCAKYNYEQTKEAEYSNTSYDQNYHCDQEVEIQLSPNSVSTISENGSNDTQDIGSNNISYIFNQKLSELKLPPLQNLNLGKAAYGPLWNFIPEDYHYKINSSLLGACLVNSYGDENILIKAGYDKVFTQIIVQQYTNKAYDVADLSEYGLQAKNDINPNIYNALVDHGDFDQAFVPFKSKYV